MSLKDGLEFLEKNTETWSPRWCYSFEQPLFRYSLFRAQLPLASSSSMMGWPWLQADILQGTGVDVGKPG